MAKSRSRGKFQGIGNNFVKEHLCTEIKKASCFLVSKLIPQGQRLETIVCYKQLSRSIYRRQPSSLYVLIEGFNLNP